MEKLVKILSHPADVSYEQLVCLAILQRFRVVALFGAMLYLVFSFLDQIAYPHWAKQFFVIRVGVSFLLLAAYFLTYVTHASKALIFLVNFIIIAAGAGICGMIYLSDGAHSNYYEGLNIVFLGLFTINSFYVFYNLFSGLGILGLYLLAVASNPTPLQLDLVGPAIFFMGATLAFVLVMTKLYSLQHHKEYIKSRQLEISAHELAQAHKQLLANEKLKDEFFANVSHELRTPLALILGPIRKHLQQNKLTREQLADLETVERNASLLLKQVNDLLDISKLDAKKLKLDYAEVDIPPFIRFIASHFEMMAKERHMHFSIESATALIAKIDKGKFERVLFNLLSNAFKFTPDGGFVICKAEADESRFTVTISDSGPGISEELQQVVFERFRQIDGSETRAFAGTGLGLAIASEFVKLHGGSIAVKNASIGGKPGGAIFTVNLPLKAPAGTPVASLSSQRDGETSSLPLGALAGQMGQTSWLYQAITAEGLNRPASKRKERLIPVSGRPEDPLVLIVEDHPEMNRFIAQAFTPNWRVIRAYNGREALEKLASCSPDLIITDVMMPEMSGEELINKVRAMDSLKQIPIMLLTARADDTLRERLLCAGVEDYLCKPFSVTELQARANNLITMKLIRDVLEQELASKSQDLIAMTQELAISKRAAEEALAAAEETARLKDEFLMNLSHELRTPLTAILGWADLIRYGNIDTTELQEALATIERNARAQLRLVNDMLDISRIIQGKLKLDLQPVDIAELVQASIRSVSATAKAKSIMIETNFLPFDGTVQCDPDRMQQIVWNLLSNAIKFTPCGGCIEVLLSREKYHAVIKIKDNGEGIEPEILPHIFKRLRQADSSTTKRHSGLGLGLAIARHLVEMHGGRIYAKSAGKSKGAVFAVEIPIHTSGLEPSSNAAQVKNTRPKSLVGMRILVVDDEPDTTQLISTLLKPYGAIVAVSASADEALKVLAHFSPDILISDIGMPNHDGIWLIETLKAYSDPSRSRIPSIALSAYTGEKMRQRALTSGYQIFLNKPIVTRDLIAAIEQLVVKPSCSKILSS